MNTEQGITEVIQGDLRQGAVVESVNQDLGMAGNDEHIGIEIGRAIVKGRLQEEDLLDCRFTRVGYQLLRVMRGMTPGEIQKSLEIHGVRPLSHEHTNYSWMEQSLPSLQNLLVLDLTEQFDGKYYGYAGETSIASFIPQEEVNTRYVIPVVPIHLGTVEERIERAETQGEILERVATATIEAAGHEIATVRLMEARTELIEALKAYGNRIKARQTERPGDASQDLAQLRTITDCLYVAIAGVRRVNSHIPVLLESAPYMSNYLSAAMSEPDWGMALATRLTRW
jgi:hypothetical protein